MISQRDLVALARARLRDARVLHRSGRFDGAVYLCGYAVELALKARICRTLRWAAFPSKNQEFQGLQTFKTHDLQMLLRLSGRQEVIKAKHLTDWSVVNEWRPDSRYEPVGTATRDDAAAMIASTSLLMKKL